MKPFSEVAEELQLSSEQSNALSIWAHATGQARRAQLEASWGKRDVDLTASFRTKAVELSLSPSQMVALEAWHASVQTEQAGAVEDAWSAHSDVLRARWGNDWTPRLAAARRGAQELGMDEAAVERMFGTVGVEETYERLRQRGEVSVTTQPLPAAISEMGPDQAAHAIATLKSDSAFMAQWMSGDRIAAGRMDALHTAAYPEAPSGGEGEPGPAAA